MLSETQKQALASLAASGSVTQTSQETGIAKSTLYSWLQSPDFLAELSAVSQITLAKMITGVFSELDAALGVMKDTIHLDHVLDVDEARTQRLKISAASNLLDRAERLSSTLATTARISRIEQMLGEAEKR